MGNDTSTGTGARAHRCADARPDAPRPPRGRNAAHTEHPVKQQLTHAPAADPGGRADAPPRGAPREPRGPRAPQAPSARQSETLEFVRRYVRTFGVAPTRKEVAEVLKVNRSTADLHLRALEKKGWLALRKDQPRYIRLLHETLPVTATGAIGADEPLLAEGRVTAWIDRTVGEVFETAPDLFVTVGDSAMDGCGLLPGDRVAVCAGTDARTGDIVVVRTANTVALRRVVHIDAERIVLAAQRAHTEDAGEVRDVARDAVRIEGVMVGALIGRRPAPDEAPARAGGAPAPE